MSANCCRYFLLMSCILALTLPRLAAEETSSSQPKLALTAALVLSPEFCATVTTKAHEKFRVGKAACAALEPSLKKVFASLTRIDDSSKSGNAQVVLEPRFADVGSTQRAFAFSNRELAVLVEWTVRDQSGKAVWIETVQGSAKRHMGNAFTHDRNVRRIVNESVEEMAEQSAEKMSSSPELLKLSAQPVK